MKECVQAQECGCLAGLVVVNKGARKKMSSGDDGGDPQSLSSDPLIV